MFFVNSTGRFCDHSLFARTFGVLALLTVLFFAPVLSAKDKYSPYPNEIIRDVAGFMPDEDDIEEDIEDDIPEGEAALAISQYRHNRVQAPRHH